jgi:glycosyltransferase involved in cell wall biosynthesis
MKKIKVLHISETFAAGVYTYIKDICQYFDADNSFDSYVIYSGKRRDTEHNRFCEDFSDKVTLIEVQMEREISPLKDLKSTIELYKMIKKIKPNIIHLHSSKAGVIGRVASKLYPRANVYYTPHGYSFVREDISKFKKKFFKSIEYLISTLFGGITIACGDTEYNYAKNIGKAALIRNGISIKSLEHLKSSEINPAFTIGTLGRISHQKNPELFNKIAEKFPDFHFKWIGDGELKNLLNSKNIEILGWMNRDEALKKVVNFDIYVQTSLWEGLPFTIIEAMTLAKPIIATNVIGNKDAVEHGFNGFLCNNLEDFVNGINTIYGNNLVKKQMEIKSYERANDLFDRDKNFQTLKHIYLKNYNIDPKTF